MTVPVDCVSSNRNSLSIHSNDFSQKRQDKFRSSNNHSTPPNLDKDVASGTTFDGQLDLFQTLSIFSDDS